MNQVVKRQEQAQAEQPSELIAFVSMIERAARDPNVDVDKMERLLAMQERIIARNAKAAYNAALVAVKPLLPVITEHGKIIVGGEVRSTYAKWEDIDEAITPILAAQNMALTFRCGVANDGKITVTAVLSHGDGHSEETTCPPLAHDSSGSKNAVQAVKSSTSYGKRIAAALLLGLRTRGEDDDGVRGGAPTTLTDEQATRVQQLVLESGANVAAFLNYMKAESISDIPASKYKEAVSMLEQKKRAKQS